MKEPSLHDFEVALEALIEWDDIPEVRRVAAWMRSKMAKKERESALSTFDSEIHALSQQTGKSTKEIRRQLLARMRG
jgi:hypothetical protein